MEHFADVSQQMRPLFHEDSLLLQLQGKFQKLNDLVNTEAEVFEAFPDIADLAPHQNNLNTAIGEIRPQIDNLRTLNDRLTVAALGSQDRLQLGVLQRDITVSIAELQNQLDHLTAIVANMYKIIRHLRATLTAQQFAIYQRLSVNLQRYFEIEMEMEVTEATLARAQTTLARALAQQNTGVILRTRINITGYQRRLDQLREEHLPCQAEVDANQEAAAEIANRDVLNLLSRMESVEYDTILEILAMTGQLAAVVQAPQSNLLFSGIANTTFWTYVYRAVAGPNTQGYNDQARVSASPLVVS